MASNQTKAYVNSTLDFFAPYNESKWGPVLFDQQIKRIIGYQEDLETKLYLSPTQTVTLLIHIVLLIDFALCLVTTLQPMLRTSSEPLLYLIQEDTVRASIYWKANAMRLKTWTICYPCLDLGITQTLFKAQTKTRKKTPEVVSNPHHWGSEYDDISPI